MPQHDSEAQAIEGGLTPSGTFITASGKRMKGVTYKSYLKSLKKGDDPLSEDAYKALPVEGEEEEEEEETTDEDSTEEEEVEEKSKKSLSVDDLMKSVEAYDAIEDALSESGVSRESFLQARLDSGTITKSEKSELGAIWTGDQDDEFSRPELQKSLLEGLEADDNTSELVDASDFLKSLVSGIDYRMDQVLGEVSRDGRATRELLKAQGGLLKGLAGVVAEQDHIIKAMGGRIETVEGTPVSPRAVTTSPRNVVSRNLAKSALGSETSGGNMTKGDVKKGLRSLMIHASERNDEAAMDRIVHATALFEQTGAIPDNIMSALNEVQI